MKTKLSKIALFACILATDESLTPKVNAQTANELKKISVSKDSIDFTTFEFYKRNTRVACYKQVNRRDPNKYRVNPGITRSSRSAGFVDFTS